MHYLSFSKISDKTVGEIIMSVSSAPGIRLADIRFGDLLIERKSPNGLYVLFNEHGQCSYIGKAGSRTLLERVASHFDLRENSWLNSFLRHLTGKPSSRTKANATGLELESVLDAALNHTIVAIQFDDPALDRKLMDKLEGALRVYTPNILNPKKAPRNYKVTTFTKIKYL